MPCEQLTWIATVGAKGHMEQREVVNSYRGAQRGGIVRRDRADRGEEAAVGEKPTRQLGSWSSSVECLCVTASLTVPRPTAGISLPLLSLKVDGTVILSVFVVANERVRAGKPKPKPVERKMERKMMRCGCELRGGSQRLCGYVW